MAGINIFDKNGYLDWAKILKITKKCPFIWVTGGRGTGKTYGCLDAVWHTGATFMYLRRTQKQADIVSKPDTHPFKALESDGRVPFLTTKAVAKDLAGVYIAEPNDEGDKYLPVGLPRCYIGSVSTFSSLRGLSFEEVKYLVYDEFCPEPHEKAIKNEAAAFLNVCETIGRNRELKGEEPLKVICLANANDIANPYFIELGIVKKAEQMMREKQTISIDESRGLCMIYLDHSPISERKKHTALYKLTANKDSQFNQMALQNRYYTDESAIIKPCRLPGEWVPICRINGITIYKHKANRTFYVSTYSTGTCKQYGSSYAEKKRFLNHFLYLWTAYLRNQIMFEEYLCLVLFENAFDASK